VCVQKAWCFVKSHHLHYPLKLLASTSFVANHWNVEPTRSNHVHSSFKNRTNSSTFMAMHAWKPLGQWPHVFEKNIWLQGVCTIALKIKLVHQLSWQCMFGSL
jgi:hypothetical protein